MINYDIVIMGDICLDWYCSKRLDFQFSKLSPNNEGTQWLDIEQLPGGSALNIAKYSEEFGISSFLIGLVGNDSSGNFLLKWLKKKGLSEGVKIDKNSETARVFIAFDKDNTRLLLANSNNSNKHLKVEDIISYEDIISNSKMLFIPGHCYMDKNATRVEAANKAIEIASNNGNSTIIFDLVPHSFYNIYPKLEQLIQLTNKVDILVSAIPTVRRYLNLGYPAEKVTRTMVKETAIRLTEYYSKFILFFGPENIGHQVIWDKSQNVLRWNEPQTFHSLHPRGYGDRLLLKVLLEYF